ncbi:hypothetical protein HPP92_016305 [Vanilla planifolia]|uniref:Uncharacterized protein n=1 Tax=Vanilla planifolia TaxID=51239 RepID=A0A835UQC7_VANPL|nr:hypothetical protein HPP92_016305 [Vanilla planifolia]
MRGCGSGHVRFCEGEVKRARGGALRKGKPWEVDEKKEVAEDEDDERCSSRFIYGMGGRQKRKGLRGEENKGSKSDTAKKTTEKRSFELVSVLRVNTIEESLHYFRPWNRYSAAGHRSTEL